MAISIDLPEDIEQDLTTRWPELPRKTKEFIAAEGYRQGILSRGQVSEILGFGYWETEAFLKEQKAYLHYGEEDLKQDLNALDRFST